VLVIGAHSDDIEIGCGGTLLLLGERVPELRVTWIVLSAEGEREQEAPASAAALLGPHLGLLAVEAFPERFSPTSER